MTTEDNCLTDNGAVRRSTPTRPTTSPGDRGQSNITLSGNEISYNDTCNWEAVSPDRSRHGARRLRRGGQFDGCGCGGGGKFWQADGADVTGNYVHDNYNVGPVGRHRQHRVRHRGQLHSPTTGAEGIMTRSATTPPSPTTPSSTTAGGPARPTGGSPTAALYISESGGDARVPGPD